MAASSSSSARDSGGARIVVIGADASGKDTYANAIVDHLVARGVEVRRRARWCSTAPRVERTSDGKGRLAHVRQHLYFAARPLTAPAALHLGAALAPLDARGRRPHAGVDVVVSWSPVWAAAHWMARTGRSLPGGHARLLRSGASAFDAVVLVEVDDEVRRARIAARTRTDASDRHTSDPAYGRAVVEAYAELGSLLGARRAVGDGVPDVESVLGDAVLGDGVLAA